MAAAAAAVEARADVLSSEWGLASFSTVEEWEAVSFGGRELEATSSLGEEKCGVLALSGSDRVAESSLFYDIRTEIVESSQIRAERKDGPWDDDDEEEYRDRIEVRQQWDKGLLDLGRRVANVERNERVDKGIVYTSTSQGEVEDGSIHQTRRSSSISTNRTIEDEGIGHRHRKARALASTGTQEEKKIKNQT